jgi:hypothetical protein
MEVGGCSAIGKKISQNIKFATCFDGGFLLDLFFDPKDGSGMFLRNIG